MVSKNDTNTDEKNKAKAQSIEAALSQIERAHGKGAIMSLDGVAEVSDGISTGSLSLDVALGGKGLPRGRIVEIYGPESSGKTTLTLHVIAQAQKRGGYAAFIDAEHAFDPVYARRLGVQTGGDRFKVSQPMSGEEALDICEILVKSAAFDVIVVDSVAALVPRAELEGEMGDSHVGLQARLMSQALRKLTASIARTNTTVIFINQIREKIGVFFGSPETTTGGRALKFYSSVRIDIRRIGQIKSGDQSIGNRTKATCVKNKCAPPFRKAEFDILFNEGINYVGDVLDLAVANKIVDKSGSWYAFGADRLGQGRERTVEALKGNPELLETIDAAVREKLSPKADPVEDPASPSTAEAGDAASANGAAARKATAPPSADKSAERRSPARSGAPAAKR